METRREGFVDLDTRAESSPRQNVRTFVRIDDNTPRRRSAAMRNKCGAADASDASGLVCNQKVADGILTKDRRKL